jgi:hypothetical protein
MVEEQKKGFRKGITKEKLMKSMTEEDWHFIDKCKEAEELEANKHAYKFFVESDQAYQESIRLQSIIIEGVSNILLLNEQIMHNKINIAKGEGVSDTDGNVTTPTELDIINYKNHGKIIQQLSITKANLARLYTFVGKQGLDRKPFFKEENYNEFVENIMARLEKTPYKL